MSKLLRFTLLGLALCVGSAAWGAQPQQSSDSGNSGQSQGNDGSQQQGARSGQMRRGAQQRKNMNELAQKLNLTDDQRAQFQKIRQNSMKQARAIRSDSSLSDEQKKQKMGDVRKQSHQQLFGILTPEQKEQLKQMREERKKEMQGSDGGGKQSSSKKSSMDDDDPFAGMTSDDDGGQV